jgi:autotransporter-associated beta strand protein
MKPRKNSAFRRSGVLIATVSFAMSLSAAHAASLTWDGNGAAEPNPDGGAGTWDVNSTANWWDGASNVKWPAAGGTDDDAVFANTAGTVTLAAGGVTANDLTFSSTGYLIQSNTLTLNGTSPTITTGADVSATISSIVAGSAGLVKNGEGTLTLGSSNIYGGATTISAGTVKLALAPSNVPSVVGSVSVAYTASPAFSTVNNNVVSALSPSANTGSSGQQNGYGSGVSVLTDGADPKTQAGIYAVNSDQSITYALSGSATGYDLSNINIYSHWNDAGRAQINLSSIQYSTVSDPGTFITIANNVTSASSVSNYRAALTAVGGVLAANAANIKFNFGAQQNQWVGYAELQVVGAAPVGANALPTATALAIAGGGTLDLNSTIQTVASLSDSGGDGGSIANSGATASTLTLNPASGSISFGGVIGGAISLVKSGGGTQILTGANTYEGTTIVNGGTLQIGNATDSGTLGSGAVTITAPGNLTFNRTDAYTVAAAIGGTGSLTQNGSGTITLSGVNGYTGGTTINAGTLTLDYSARSGWFKGVGTFTIGASGTLELRSGSTTSADSTAFYDDGTSTTFNGSGKITKTGLGYLAFALLSPGITGFTGLIDVQQGILGTNTNNWGPGLMDLNIAAGAVLDMRTATVNIDALDGAGMIYKTWTTASTLSLGNSDGSGNFSGSIKPQAGAAAGGATPTGMVSLVKNGSGTQTLSGENTYTGTTTINGGALALAGAATLASPTIAVASGGTLALAGDATLIAPTTAITLAEGGRLDTSGLTADFTLATGQTLNAGRATGFAEDVKGNLVVSDGSLQIAGPGNTAGTLTQTGKLTLGGGGTLKFDLAAADTPGGGVNDLIAVTGDLALVDSTTISINKLSGTLVSGSYTLISCSGTLTGNVATNLVLDFPNTGRQSYALTQTANSVMFNVTGVPASLVWTGASATNPTFWDLNTTANWTGGPNGKFADGDVVLFDDTATATIVDLQGWMAPESVTFNNTIAKPYSIIGTGSIDGATGITKNGNGLVTITTDNSNSGAVALNGGIVSIATGDGLGTGPITIAGGTLAFTGATAAWTRGITLNAGGGVFDITDNAGDLTSTGPVAGVGTLTKTGAGKLALNYNNSYTGTTTVAQGTLAITSGTPVGFTFASTALNIAAGAVFAVGPLGDFYITAPITGAGTVLSVVNSIRPSADNQAFTGTFQTEGTGSFEFVNAAAGWSANAKYVLNGSWMRFYGSSAGRTIDLGSLAGANPASSIGNWNGSGTTTLRVGALGTDTTFAGEILNQFASSALMALTKVGTGKLTLTGANGYTGATTITQGTLQVDGSTAAGSAVTVQTTATLAGTGTVGGSVSVEAGGFVAPGNAGIGALTVGSAAITGTYQCQLDVASGDQVVVSGALTVNPGATIAVSTLGAPAAASYLIATYGSLAGGVPAVTGIPAGYVLDTATAGQLKLVKSGGFGAWADSFEGLTDKTPGGDPDNDGIKNLVEYVIGGDPRVSSTGFLPKQAIVGTNLVLSYQRSDASEADTTQTGQWSTNLVDWNNIAPVQVSENDTAPDDMTISIPLSNAAGGKLFGRLHVTMP